MSEKELNELRTRFKNEAFKGQHEYYKTD